MTEPAIWPPWPPYDDDLQNSEPLLSDIGLKLASSALALDGMITGHARLGASDNAANKAPLNPSGDFGHDHSGKPFGRPLFRSVAAFTSDPLDRLSSYILGPDPGGTQGRPARPIETFSQDPNNKGFVWSNPEPFPIWIPPCPAGSGGAYTRAALRIDFEVTHTVGTIVAGDSLNLVIRNDHPAVPPISAQPNGFYHLNLEWTLPGTPGDKTVSVDGSTQWLEVVPGQINPLAIGTYFELDNSGSARGYSVVIDEVEIGVSSRHL